MRRTSLAHVSKRRSAESVEYRKAKEQAWLRDRGQCQARRIWPEIDCHGRIDPHHVAPTGRFPELRCDVDNLKCVCRGHHDAIHHQDPVRARELGLLV